jgi:hypothetical protein
VKNKIPQQTLSQNAFWMFETSYWYQKLNSSQKSPSQKAADKIFIQSGGIKRCPICF